MKKKKYRIKEYVAANGTKYFRVQERFLFVWLSILDHYFTYEEAKEAVETRRAFEILESITHKVD